MRESLLLRPGGEIRGTPIWSRFLVAGASLYVGAFGILLFWRRWASIDAAFVVAVLAIPATVLLGVAAWYWWSVEGLTGTRRGAWSLPEAASAHTDVEPDRALRHLQSVAQSAFPWVRPSLADQSLTLTRRGWWGDASVNVEATVSGGGTELRLQAAGPSGAPSALLKDVILRGLVNNLIARGIIARVLTELANDGKAMQA